MQVKVTMFQHMSNTADYIRLMQRIKAKTSQLQQLAIELGLCPANTPVKKLPFNLGKLRHSFSARLMFTVVPS